MTNDRWIEITVRVPPDDVDPVASILTDFTGQPVAIEPQIRRIEGIEFGYEELDAPVTVRAYAEPPLPDSQRDAIEAALAALLLSAPVEPPTYRPLDPTDWSEEWKRFYDVQHIGGRLVVRPSWLEYAPREGEVVVELDPGTAFGTGQHETTRLCLAAIERHLRPGESVLDVGCGSGILAIAAAKLGAGRIRAIDVDPDTIAVTEANAAINDVHTIEAAAGSVGDAWPWPDDPARGVELLVLNISSRAVLLFLPEVIAALAPDGRAILSGFLARDAGEIEAAVIAAGLHIIEVTPELEWCAIVAERQPATR